MNVCVSVYIVYACTHTLYLWGFPHLWEYTGYVVVVGAWKLVIGLCNDLLRAYSSLLEVLPAFLINCKDHYLQPCGWHLSLNPYWSNLLGVSEMIILLHLILILLFTYLSIWDPYCVLLVLHLRIENIVQKLWVLTRTVPCVYGMCIFHFLNIQVSSYHPASFLKFSKFSPTSGMILTGPKN